MPDPLHTEELISVPTEISALRVLSLHLSNLGIATYARAMQAYFDQSRTCAVDSIWWDDDRNWKDRVVRRLLVLDDAALGARAKNSGIRRQNLDLHRLRDDLGPALAARRLLKSRLRSGEYDILHVHPQSLAHASVDLMRQIPTILHSDMTAAQLAQDRTDPRCRWTFAPNIALDRRVFGAARAIVAWSRWVADSLRTDYGVPSSKIHIIPPGVDLAGFDPAPHPPRIGRVRLLFAGFDFARKGGNDLLAVFESSLSELAELHIMTSAPIAVRHRHVHIHKGIAAFSPEWRKLYRESDIFVMPTYFEGLPMACVEAAAASLPIVSSKICGIPEIVLEGENGLLVTPGRRDELAGALRALIENADRRSEMGRRGREIVEERFDAGANFALLEAILHQEAEQSTPLNGQRDRRKLRG